MKNYFKSFLLVLLGTILGYCLFPILNSDHRNISQTKSVEILATKRGINSVSPENSHANGTQEKKKLIEYKAIPVETELKMPQEQANETASFSDNYNESSPEDEYAREELDNWVISHIDKLDRIIDENMPVTISSDMKSSLMKNNQMLNDPVIQQDSVDDDNWAFLMEQDIRAHIAQHELATGFELLNVSCKQLICDVVGIERESSVWMKIYRGFYSFPNILLPKEGSKPVNIIRMDNDLVYVYAQIMFKVNKSS